MIKDDEGIVSVYSVYTQIRTTFTHHIYSDWMQEVRRGLGEQISLKIWWLLTTVAQVPSISGRFLHGNLPKTHAES